MKSSFVCYCMISMMSGFVSGFENGDYKSVGLLKSCLADHGVRNFYTREDDPSSYTRLLDFSIQNRRFAGPTVPKPAAIIVPASKEELADSIVCCRTEGFEMRVRCGGHSYEGASYVSEDGIRRPFVVIDMMGLSRVTTVDTAAEVGEETAWVEGGATLGQVYSSIAEASRDLGFSAGSCPTVGIGGHIAGGGFGLLSRKHGLAADNVVDALLVNAEGKILDRADMGEDVFWAIRGGGGGVWGVVYAWKIRLVRIPATVTGFIVSRPGYTRVQTLVEQWQHIAPRLPDEFYLSAFVGAGLPEFSRTGMSATFKGFYLGNKTESLSILDKEFPELEILPQDCQEMSWIESILYFSGLKNGTPISALKDRFLHTRNYFKAKSDYARKPILSSGLSLALNWLQKEAKGYVILDPYGGAMDRISSEAIPFPHRKGNLFTIQYLVEWGEEDDVRSEHYIDWIRGFYDAMEGHVSSCPRAAYVNYVDYDLGVMDSATADGMGTGDCVERARAWGEKYFLGNYERLVKAKTVVDPLNVFRNPQGIPPSSGHGRGEF